VRGQLTAALLFVGTQSKLALKQREAADRVDAAFARIAAASTRMIARSCSAHSSSLVLP